MRNRNPFVHIAVFFAIFVAGVGVFQSVGAAVSVVRPKLGVDLDSPGRNVFRFHQPSVAGGVTSFAVPSGKRLVIRHIDAFVPGTVPGLLGITAILGNQGVTHPLPTTLGPVAGGGYYVEDTTIYADGGTSVFIQAPTGSQITVTGDLLDCTRLLTGKIRVDCNATTVP